MARSSEPQATSVVPAKIVGLGVIVVDLLAVVESYPQVDTKQDVRSSLVQVGGPVPTALAQLTRWGHSCHMIGRWGDDALGSVIEIDLDGVGIAFEPECCDNRVQTGHSQVWIDARTGQRTSVTQRAGVEEQSLSAADGRSLKSARIVHLDGWPSHLAQEAARIARAAGATVVVDTGSPKSGMDELLRLADVVNAPRRFVEEFLGTSDIAAGAAAIARAGPAIVTVTDGEHGAVMCARGELLRTSALQLSRCVDTNGAGDVFCAGVMYSLLCDWPADRSLRFAAAAAGLKCQSLGNRDGLADLNEICCAAESLITA